MVTMPSEAATVRQLMRDLVAQGMDCIRINCAHDDAEAWYQMVENLRRAKVEQARECKILMDLGGPKLRTGPIETGPAVRTAPPTRRFRSGACTGENLAPRPGVPVASSSARRCKFTCDRIESTPFLCG